MFKGLGNLASMVKQAQQIGARMQGISEELKTRRATGNAGGGLVELDVNGLGEVLACRFDPKLFEQPDRELLEDLTAAAANDAMAKVRQLHAEAMQQATGGMEMPGLNDMLGKLMSGDGPPPSA